MHPMNEAEPKRRFWPLEIHRVHVRLAASGDQTVDTRSVNSTARGGYGGPSSPGSLTSGPSPRPNAMTRKRPIAPGSIIRTSAERVSR
jgi:hypothetical protein